MHEGWLNIDDNWYYCGSGGALFVNRTVIIGNTAYIFDESGVCTNH